LLAYYG
jgi:hypothetical protein